MLITALWRGPARTRSIALWSAIGGGIIVFGSLMAAVSVGEQYPQNVLGHPTFEFRAPALPAVVFVILATPRSAKLVESRAASVTLLIGYGFRLAGPSR